MGEHQEMETTIKNSSFGFSWADEVEREEQEEEQEAPRREWLQEKPIRKINPFGDARPREIVLQEKGIDWQKLDREMDRDVDFSKDKRLKENISVETASSISKHLSCIPGCQDRNKPEKQNRRSVRQEGKRQNTPALVPPLVYPPKDIGYLGEQNWIGHNDGSHQNNYQCKSAREWETENTNINIMRLKDKKLKENISVLTTSISKREHCSFRPGCQDRNKPEMHNARSVTREQQKRNASALVSPLRYPPKGIGFLEEQNFRGHHDKLNAGLDYPDQNDYPCKSGMAQQTERMDLNTNRLKFGSPDLVHNWPLVGVHNVAMLSRQSCVMKREDEVKNYPNIETINFSQFMEHSFNRRCHSESLISTAEDKYRNGKKKILVDLHMEGSNLGKQYDVGKEYYWKNTAAVSESRNCMEQRRFICAGEVEANDCNYHMHRSPFCKKYCSDVERKFIGPIEKELANYGNCNMQRLPFGHKYNHDKEYSWECIEDARKPDYQEPHGWRNIRHTFNRGTCILEGSYEDQNLGSSSQLTKYRGTATSARITASNGRATNQKKKKHGKRTRNYKGFKET